jgi:hypothetical protein
MLKPPVVTWSLKLEEREMRFSRKSAFYDGLGQALWRKSSTWNNIEFVSGNRMLARF